MTVFKKPLFDENASDYTNAPDTQSYDSLSPAIQPPLRLTGKRQFMRPAVFNEPSEESQVASVGTATLSGHPVWGTGNNEVIARPRPHPPAKKQFIGPIVSPKKVASPSILRIPPLQAPAPPASLPFRQQSSFTSTAQAVLTPPQLPLSPLPVPIVTPPAAQPQPEVRTEVKSRNRWRRGKLTQQQGKKQKKKKSRGKRIRRLLIVVSVLTIIAVVFFSQGNGAAGAWLADTMRAVLGPSITAQVESWYLGLSDTTHNIQYQLSGQHVDAPWSVGTAPPTPVPPPTWSTLKPMPLGHIAPVVSPAIGGEGAWYPQEQAPAPYNYLPLDAKAFIRPDPTHPYAIVTMLQFDMRFINLHMVAGTVEPGGPRGYSGPGVIPAAAQQGNALLAAFNGGFKYADGQYGMMTNGVVYVPPQNGSATIAVTREGKIILGAWGVDPRFTGTNHDLVAWRQNASLLINNGIINPLTSDGAAWGGTILNSAYTWRSGLGITANGTLIYAAGDYLTALTLGKAMKAAGAVMAMQTDINPFWVRAFLYSHNSNGSYNIIKLNPAMQGTGTEYLYGNERDFFYLTRYSPPPPPQPAHARETYPQ